MAIYGTKKTPGDAKYYDHNGCKKQKAKNTGSICK